MAILLNLVKSYAANLAFTRVEVDRRSGVKCRWIGGQSHKLVHATSTVIDSIAYNYPLLKIWISISCGICGRFGNHLKF